MKIVRQNSVNILDLGEVLAIIPHGISADLDGGGGLYGDSVPCGGFTRRQTKAGREAIDVLPGQGYVLNLRDGAGDRKWNRWSQRRPVRSEHGEVFAAAVSVSHGGGCWFELSIVPAAGYESQYEAGLADEGEAGYSAILQLSYSR